MLFLCTLKNLFFFFSLSFLFFFRVCLAVVYPHSLHHAQLARALFRHVHECWPAFGARLIFGTAGQFKRDLTQSPDHSRNKRYVNLSDCGCYKHVCWIQCTRTICSFPVVWNITSPSSSGVREWHPPVGGVRQGWVSISSAKRALEAGPSVTRWRKSWNFFFFFII